MTDTFRAHGTKIIGSVTAAIGSVAAIDPTLLQAMIGAKGVGYLTLAMGLLTVMRGMQNSANNDSPPK